MFYKARMSETGNMWDTWLYWHQGTFYLYYLAKSGPQWDNISLATSVDGVHWQERGRILSMGEGVTWMGTGSTWLSPSHVRNGSGRFQMNFSEWKGPRQTIFFAESTDLQHWTRLSDAYEFRQDERWYEPNGRWDCIWTIPRADGGLYGYWTATPKPETGGRFGFGETEDGVTWRALEPPKVIGVGEGEVGAIEQIGQRYYMMFGTGGLMVTLIADKPTGPFHLAEKNPQLLAGHTYFSRFFRTPDGLLANHHSIARDGQVYFGTLKSAQVDSEGTLRLGWWPGNEQMDPKPIRFDMPGPLGSVGNAIPLSPRLDVETGCIVTGEWRLSDGAGAAMPALYIECQGEQDAAIRCHSDGSAELGSLEPQGLAFHAEKRVNRQMDFHTPTQFRLLVQHSLLEFYLDDILIECFSLPTNATGRIGWIQL